MPWRNIWKVKREETEHKGKEDPSGPDSSRGVALMTSFTCQGSEYDLEYICVLKTAVLKNRRGYIKCKSLGSLILILKHNIYETVLGLYQTYVI